MNEYDVRVTRQVLEQMKEIVHYISNDLMAPDAAAPEGKIVKSDVSIAKNYLSEKEMRSLERIVSAYLDLAEDRAEHHIPMTMEGL